jgi:hypothetical protein
MICKNLSQFAKKYFSKSIITEEIFIKTDGPVKKTLDHLEIKKIDKNVSTRKLET